MSEEFDLFLKEQLKQEYMQKLQTYIRLQRQTKEIYPAPNLVLNALRSVEYYNLKVVIIGQEAYNTPNTAMGIAYSSIGQVFPRELIEIQNEIRRSEYGKFPSNTTLFRTPNLIQWVDQGVLMVPNILTAEKEVTGAHKGQGWELFILRLVEMLNKHYNQLVFMLWGKDNWGLENYIDKKHAVLKAFAPGSGKFYGCGHFTLCNEFILKTYTIPGRGLVKAPINWHLLN